MTDSARRRAGTAAAAGARTKPADATPAGSGGPSAWSRRLPTVVLALIGGAIASYLAACQLGLVATPWDPIFGAASTDHVLTSRLSRSFPVPDAALGALGYAADVLLGLAGGEDRWRRHAWLVVLFGLVVAGMALAGIGLVLAQATVIGAFCTLCLTSAALSIVIAARSADEVAAAVGHLRHPGRRTDEDAAASPSGSSGVEPDEDASAHSAGPLPVARSARDRAKTPQLTDAARPSELSRPPDAAALAAGPDPSDPPSRIGRVAPDPSLRSDHTERSHAMAKVVVITGASAGIGRATVRAFAKDGWDVGLISRNEEALRHAADEVRQEGGRALVLPLDVSDANAVDQAAERVEQELGPIDVWVNDAMLSVFSPVSEMKPEEYERVTQVTYLGYVYGTLAALKRMRPRDSGVIVQVGSALAYRGIPLQSAYCAAKHAIEGFCDSLWTELIHDGSQVKLTMVQMPALNTPQFDWVKSRLPNRAQPVPPIFQPEVAASAILYAAKHPRRELFVGRSTDLAVYANRILPGVLDWYLGKTGYKAQQTDQPEDPDRPDNLWHPLPGDHGAHGRFDDRAAEWSPQLWAATHRPIVAAGLAAMAAIAVMTGRMIGDLANGRRA